MPRWSEALVKNRIDPGVFADNAEAGPAELQRIKDLKFYCKGVFESVERIQNVRAIITKKAKEKPAAPRLRQVATAILDELKEIERDLKFAKSRRGKFVLFANDWTQDVYKVLRADARFDGILVGASPEKETLVAHGTARDAPALIDAIRIIANADPGVPLEFRVTVAPAK